MPAFHLDARVFGVVLALVCALSSNALAQREQRFTTLSDVPYQISANSVSYEEDRDIYEASGDVRIEQQGRQLTADWVLFSGKSQIGVAAGNVVIRDAGDVVQAEFAWVDLGSLRLLAERATVDSARPGFLITGDELEKVGDQSYRVQNGIFTTCRCPPGSSPRPWDIRATETNIRVGGYAVAKNVTFRTLGVPVLYTPLFIFPVKTERQTGFLQPSLATTRRGGKELQVPFFWAARDNLNITLTPIYFEKRGIKNDVDIEYVFGEEGYGEGGFAFLFNDKEIDGNDPTEPFSADRYAFWLRHEQPLVPGTRFGVDLKRISDNQFIVDFENFSRRERSARFLESTAYLTRARPGTYTGAEFTMLDDLQSPNDLDRDDEFLQRLPDLRFNWLPREVLSPDRKAPLYASFDARYTYYYQRKDRRTLRGRTPVNGQFFDTGQDGTFDDDEPTAEGIFNGADNHADNPFFDANGTLLRTGTEGDGIFQEGELLADSGQRIDLYPRLSTTRRFGFIETLSELGFRETIYLPEQESADTRGLFTGRLDARARFARTYRFGSLRLRHQIEPRIGFTLLDGQSQRRNPLFVPASSVRAERVIDGDPRVLLRDESDRIDDERFLNFALSNRIYANPLAAGGFPRQVGELRIGGGYDFLEGRPSNIFVDARLDPNPNLAFTAEVGYDPRDSRVEEGTFGIAVFGSKNYAITQSAPERRNSLAISYNYVRDFEGLFENFLRKDDVFEDFERNLSRINQASLLATYVLTRQIDFFAGGYMSFEQSDTKGGNLGVSFKSSCACWELVAQMDKTTRPEDTRFTIELRLAGIGRQKSTRFQSRSNPSGR
jgi:lipopolysaccharide assembly outer membrane protein LptD (OstA)